MTTPTTPTHAFTPLRDLPPAPPVPPRRASRGKLVALFLVLVLLPAAGFAIYRASLPAYIGTSVHTSVNIGCSGTVFWNSGSSQWRTNTGPGIVATTASIVVPAPPPPLVTTPDGSAVPRVVARNALPGDVSGTMFFDTADTATFTSDDGKTTLTFQLMSGSSTFAAVGCAIS